MDFDDIPAASEEIEVVTDPMQYLPEPEADDALTLFNRQWQLKLEARRTAEMEAENNVKSQAADDLANWALQKKIKVTAKKDSNRSEEQVLLETLESEVDGGLTWERVAKLIDSGADAADSNKADVSRMRKLFIQLKNEPLETTRGASN